MRRKCLWRNGDFDRKKNGESDEYCNDGFCLLITGGMMDGETAVVERLDGFMISLPIRHVKFNDALAGNHGGKND